MHAAEHVGGQMFGRRDFLASVTAVSVAGGSMSAWAESPSRRFEMTVINPEVVSGGCGLCVIMRTPAGRTYLFDTANGMDGAAKNNGKDISVSTDGRTLNVTTDPTKRYPEKEK